MARSRRENLNTGRQLIRLVIRLFRYVEPEVPYGEPGADGMFSDTFIGHVSIGTCRCGGCCPSCAQHGNAHQFIRPPQRITENHSQMHTDSQPLPTDEQRQALCDLMHEAFVGLRYLTEDQAHDSAYAFHNLPKAMFGWGHWSIEGTRARLMDYQKKHQDNLGFDYVAAFDAIFKH